MEEARLADLGWNPLRRRGLNLLLRETVTDSGNGTIMSVS
ncbi:hypothetical protein GFS60_02128 [Rhodococcus sp. WAY2]|nr:hypothetical protein GFS60_02128 [Rhodococcus sp. WAY2]